MDIKSLNSGNNIINSINGQNVNKITETRPGGKISEPSIVVNVAGKDTIETKYIPAQELEPRLELVASVSKNVTSGVYNTRDMIKNIAGKLIDHSIASGIPADSGESGVRMNKVENAEANISNNAYNNTDIYHKTADKLVVIYGITGLIGNSDK